MGQQTFTSTTTWVCPPGVFFVTAECWGASGSSGGATGNPAAGGGAAGGAYARKLCAVVPGTTYTVTVASVKVGNNTDGATGDPSWFNTAGTVFAEGGPGGLQASVNSTNGTGGLGTAASSIGDVVFRGGNGSDGNFTAGAPGGAGGGGAGPNGAGGDASGGTAGTGSGELAGDGRAGVANSTPGVSGVAAGGAPSGGKANTTTDRPGGNSGPGRVRLTWEDPQIQRLQSYLRIGAGDGISTTEKLVH